MKKTGLKWSVNFFSVDFDPVDTNNILDIPRYLMKKTKYKMLGLIKETLYKIMMFGFIEKMFIGLLTGLVNGSNHTKWLLLSNQKCMIQPTLINLHPNEHNQEFPCYPFAVKLDVLEVIILLIPNQTEDLYLSMLSMNTGIT